MGFPEPLIASIQALIDAVASPIAVVDRSWTVVIANVDAIALLKLRSGVPTVLTDVLPRLVLNPGPTAPSDFVDRVMIIPVSVSTVGGEHSAPWFRIDVRPLALPDHSEWYLVTFSSSAPLARELPEEPGERALKLAPDVDLWNPLWQAETYAHKMLEMTVDPLETLDPEGRITFVNRASSSATGVEREAMVGTRFEQYFTDPDVAKNIFQQALAKGYVVGVPLTIRHVSGDLTHAIYSIFVYRSESGTILGLFASARDISDLKKVQEERLRTNEYARCLLYAAMDPLFVTDHQGIITDVNDATEKVTGRRRSALVGAAVQSIFCDPKEASDWHKLVIERGSVAGFSSCFRHESGTSTEVVLNSNVYFDPRTGLKGVLAAAHDITEMRNTERILGHALEQAKSGTLLKDLFIANMSHEVRTPLSALIGMTDLLHDTPLNAEQSDCVSTIMSCAKHLLCITNDILDFSKIESGKMELENIPFDLHTCVEESFDLVSLRAAEKRLELAYEFSDNLPRWVIGDPSRLRQVLANYLTNAVKFTASGEITVSVSSNPDVHETQPVGIMFTFSVRDTGIGVANDRLDRLYSSFSQVDASTTRVFGGTGLGLAISRRLAELMHGHVWVESVFGKGSIFYFTASLIPVDPQPREDNRALRGLQVALVDATDCILRIHSELLRKAGLEVRATTSDVEAAGWFAATDYRPRFVLIADNVFNSALVSRLEELSLEKVTLVCYGNINQIGARDRLKPSSVFLAKPLKWSILRDTLLSAASSDAGQGLRTDVVESDRWVKQRHLSVLVAEDNPINSRVAVRLLQRCGCSASVAQDGLEAVDMARDNFYDIIFMDLHMPNMDGVEATTEIHKLPKYQHGETMPRIVALTASSAAIDQKKCEDAGMEAFLAKPMTMQSLRDALAKYGTPHT